MDALDQIRDFNRFYTGALGLLGRSYLDSGRSLAEVRVVHDLASEGRLTARQIARSLAMDEAQLSRILSRLIAEGLLVRHQDPGDMRQSFLTLTADGRALAASFVTASRRALSTLVPSPARQLALAERLAAARAVLALEGDIALRPAKPGDAGWIISEHGRLYAEAEGYDHHFEAMVARIVADALDCADPRARIFIAERLGQRLGSITCVPEDEQTARLRLFFVLPEARGLGLGQMLHDSCVNHALAQRFTRMVLLTHESHVAATSLYAKNGWTLTRSEARREYGQDVIEQDWLLSL
jgi:DNA-binding MarR family transcriptional regulator/GNAT superfamily N-acetyltransferase